MLDDNLVSSREYMGDFYWGEVGAQWWLIPPRLFEGKGPQELPPPRPGYLIYKIALGAICPFDVLASV